MVASTGYIVTGSTTPQILTLPSSINLGQTIEVVGYGTGLWQIATGATNQFINFGNTGTTPGTGILSATARGDSVRMTCVSASTVFIITSSIGNIFFN